MGVNVSTTTPSQAMDGTGLPRTILLSSRNSRLSGSVSGLCAELLGPIELTILIWSDMPLPWTSGSRADFPKLFQVARMRRLRFAVTAIRDAPLALGERDLLLEIRQEPISHKLPMLGIWEAHST